MRTFHHGPDKYPLHVCTRFHYKDIRKIKEAGTPDNFNADFLSTKLGFKGGNYRTFISWAKKAGLLNSDGTPTLLYKSFRNPSSSKASLARAIKSGYAELYSRNEYCHELDKKAFKGLVMEATGEPHDSKVVDNIVSTFFNLGFKLLTQRGD